MQKVGIAIVTAFVTCASLQAAEVLKTKSGPVNVESLAKLEFPWAMAYLPDGKLLITEKPGRLRVFADGKLSEQPISGAPKVAFKGQGGLLDVIVDPKFNENKFIYLSYAEAAEQQSENAQVNPDPRLGGGDKTDTVLKGQAVARAKLDGNQLTDLKVIWRQTPKTIGLGHFGAHMAFAPDGKLFITSGERQRFEPAQDMTGNLGKIIRINPDGSIPNDNPFVKDGKTPAEIWSSGHRNPLGIAIHPVTHAVWVHEMGPAQGDELNLIERGKNYGWPVVSNGDNYDGSPIPDHPTRPEFAAPAWYWFPAISPSGFIFYTGDHFPQWKNNAFIGGLSAETLVRVQFEGDKKPNREERLHVQRRIRDICQAPDGTILLLSDGKEGELLKLSKAAR
jgi:aldose sugar dehydrogenase